MVFGFKGPRRIYFCQFSPYPVTFNIDLIQAVVLGRLALYNTFIAGFLALGKARRGVTEPELSACFNGSLLQPMYAMPYFQFNDVCLFQEWRYITLIYFLQLTDIY